MVSDDRSGWKKKFNMKKMFPIVHYLYAVIKNLSNRIGQKAYVSRNNY